MKYGKILTLLIIIFTVIQINYDIYDRVNRMISGADAEVVLEGHNIGRWHETEIEELVIKIAKDQYQAPKNAYFDSESEKIISEQIGQQILIKETVNKALEAPKGTKLEAVQIPLYPMITEEFLSTIDVHLSGYTTGIWGSGQGRITNIEIATQEINNTLIFPGQIFSFNQETLPRTWERGYRFAPIIVNGDAMGIGGGICQVSSTAYNAALQAELEIIERHPHGNPVNYVPPGKDAAVAGDYLDLKFRNNTENILLLTAYFNPGAITVEIYKSRAPFGPMSMYNYAPLAFNVIK